MMEGGKSGGIALPGGVPTHFVFTLQRRSVSISLLLGSFSTTIRD